MPRPTKRTPETVEAILSRLAKGEPLAVLLRDSDDFPCVSTWLDWCHADESLALAYGRAREQGEEVIAADTLAIADDGRNDWMEKVSKEGDFLGWTVNGEHVQRSKLRIETRLKLLAIWNPKKWGTKLDLTTGGDKIEPGTTDVAAKAAAILAMAKERKDG